MKIAMRLFVFMAVVVMTAPSALPVQAQTTSTTASQKFDGGGGPPICVPPMMCNDLR